ncbi:cell wall hydrolase [Sphingobium sp. AN641]|uniref:cell wall hydrolase n=1 Tax=Sphingobium sp. AN641 TaxID=3133443 RepID=UPI0030C28395
MTRDRADTDGPPWAAWLLWLAIFAGLPALVAWNDVGDRPPSAVQAALSRARAVAARAVPPPVEPVKVYALERDSARTLNAAIPFSTAPNPAARPFVFTGSATDLARAVDCLAAAQLYEAGDDAVGQRSVAQVVLNRVRHPAFPKTVCGVVFQGQERTTGCQFTFTCDGALTRVPSAGAWDRARMVAREMLSGQVYTPVGHATHYHTDWVVPYWSSSLDKVAAVGSHLFFRWRGWWGTGAAFGRGSGSGEPLIGRIARISLAHHGAPDAPLPNVQQLAGTHPSGAALLAARPQQAIGTDSLGKSFGAGRLIAIAPGARTFLLELSGGALPDSWPTLAQTFCAGRSECRIMAWRAGGGVPVGFPLSGSQIDAMAFAYIHNAASGLQRALWNCNQTPRPVRRECMRVREPAQVQAQAQTQAIAPIPALAGVRRKERFEIVRISQRPGTEPPRSIPAKDSPAPTPAP